MDCACKTLSFEPLEHDASLRVFVENVAGAVRLSAREREVLHLLVKGYASKEIAVHLERCPTTVNTFLMRLCKKLGCHTRVEALAVLLRMSLSGELRR